MVVIDTFTSPRNNSSALSTNGVLIGTTFCPYNSTDGICKNIKIQVPIGFSFVGNKYNATPATLLFTMSIPAPTICKVFKNGTFLQNITVSKIDTNATSKSFNVNAMGDFSINSFYYGLHMIFKPSVASANGDTYTFYLPFTYSLTSNPTSIQGEVPPTFSQNITVNTSNSTSSFTNASYASGSSNSTGYISYSLTNTCTYNSNWSQGNTLGYAPTISSSNFSGMLQSEGYYCNNLWATTTINLKQVDSVAPYIMFYDNDSLGANPNTTIFSGSGSLNFNAVGNNSFFKFNGGYVILGNGYKARQGQANSAVGNTLNQWWSGGGVLQAWVDATNVGNFTLCDYRIKENIQPASNVLDRLCGVNMFNYEMKDIGIFKKNGTQIGFFAHELKDAFPELNNLVEGEKDALTSEGTIQPQIVNAELTHLLMKSIQELNAKVIELSNKIVELENKLL